MKNIKWRWDIAVYAGCVLFTLVHIGLEVSGLWNRVAKGAREVAAEVSPETFHVITQAEAEEVVLIMELAGNQSKLVLLAAEHFPTFAKAITEHWPTHIKDTEKNIEVLRDRVANWRARVEERTP